MLEDPAADRRPIGSIDPVAGVLKPKQPRTRDLPGERLAVLEREHRIRGAVDHQRRDIDLGQIAAEVREPRIDARIRRVRRGTGGDLEARPQRSVADPVRRQDIGVVEVREEGRATWLNE